MIRYIYDKKYNFKSLFDTKTGMYIRTGILDENGKDTNVDPFMAFFPQLLDIGIMQTCVCAKKCQVDCYQRAIDRCGDNMSLENYEKIMKQCKDKMFQCALGGAGDVDTHENFEEIVAMSRMYGIVPSFTTSGIAMTPEKAQICKKYCGAVAVSEHFAPYTEKAINMLIEAGVKTNIHYVLSNKTIDKAIEILKNGGYDYPINAVVFLLYKPVGLGKEENMLKPNDAKMKEFFEIIGQNNFKHKIGFDSCSCSGIINYSSNIALESLDFCEGGRFSAYIDANMHMMPCSFANQDSSWFIDLNKYTIQEAWDSEIFDKFRYSLKHSCPSCPNRDACGGGCPLVNQITLCDKSCRKFVNK